MYYQKPISGHIPAIMLLDERYARGQVAPKFSPVSVRSEHPVNPLGTCEFQRDKAGQGFRRLER